MAIDSSRGAVQHGMRNSTGQPAPPEANAPPMMSQRSAPVRRLRFGSNALCAMVAAWVVLVANRSFWKLLFNAQGTDGRSALFAASVAVALFGLHVLLFRLLSPGRTVRATLSVMLVVAAMAGWFMDTYGIAIDASMLRNVIETDVPEAWDFVGWSLLWRVTWQAVIPIVLLWRVPSHERSSWRSLKDYAIGAVAGFALVLGAGLPMYSHYASFFRNQDSARYLVAPANVVVGSANLARKTLRARQPFVPVGLDASRSPAPRGKPLLVLVVVGETARAANFSLSGYQRPTNPRLSQKGVFNFRDVTSCGTATAVSVPCMFSDLPRDEFDLAKAARRDTVLDILHRAGVGVSWIDNQSGCKGVCARLPTRAAEIDHPSSCSDGECLDDALLYSLAAELPHVSADSVIVMHSMGSHGPTYHRRVTPDHEVFVPTCATERIETCTREQIVNAYDNSIEYTDFVLSGLIDRLDAARDTVDSVLLYVSDHGESLGENGLYLHGEPYLIAPDVQKRVPMLLWFSSGAVPRLELDTTCLRERLSVPMSHDNFAHMLLGLADVQTAVYRPALDVLRTCRGTQRPS